MGKGSKLPTRFIRLGGFLVRYGRVLECVERPGNLIPCECCRGCWFSTATTSGGKSIVNCNDIQCSSWDRMDGRNVWFVESASGGEEGVE